MCHDAQDPAPILVTGLGAFHLGEQRQQHHSELRHRIIRAGGIDADRIGKVSHADAAFAQVVNQVENLAYGPAEPIQGVDDDHVAVASIAQQGLQPGPVNRRTGLFVGVDVSGLYVGAGERVDLPVEVLLGGRYPRISSAELSFLTRAER